MRKKAKLVSSPSPMMCGVGAAIQPFGVAGCAVSRIGAKACLPGSANGRTGHHKEGDQFGQFRPPAKSSGCRKGWKFPADRAAIGAKAKTVVTGAEN